MTRSETAALPFSRLLRLVLLRRTLRQRDRSTRVELVRHQAQSLATLRARAYARSPFYQRQHAGLADAPLEHLPVLTRADLMAHWDDVVTDRSLRLDDVRRFVETLGGAVSVPRRVFRIDDGGEHRPERRVRVQSRRVVVGPRLARAGNVASAAALRIALSTTRATRGKEDRRNELLPPLTVWIALWWAGRSATKGAL